MSEKERPIIFNDVMVRAILAGRKTQTRRVVKFPPHDGKCAVDCDQAQLADAFVDSGLGDGEYLKIPCGHGAWQRKRAPWGIGDRDYAVDERGEVLCVVEITDVRVQRVQDISEEDAIAEGVGRYEDGCGWGISADDCSANAGEADGWGTPITAIARLWDSIFGPGAWDRNDWVWALTFRRVEP